MSPRSDKAPPVTVVGGGPSGLIAALALASGGLPVTLVAPPRAPDPRTTALMDGSVRALEALGLWERLREDASPLRVMRLVDGTRRLLRAPEVEFRAGELGLEGFAWNLENEVLLAALDDAVAEAAGIERVAGAVRSVTDGAEQVAVELDDGRTIAASLVAAADGRNSPAGAPPAST